MNFPLSAWQRVEEGPSSDHPFPAEMPQILGIYSDVFEGNLSRLSRPYGIREHGRTEKAKTKEMQASTKMNDRKSREETNLQERPSMS